MLVLMLGGVIVIYEKIMGSAILLSELILVKLVLPINLLIFRKILRLRCGCEDASSIEFWLIVFGDINNHIDLSLVISIYSNRLMLQISFIFNKTSFGSYSPSSTSILAFCLGDWFRFSVMNLVYISVKYIVFKHLLMMFLWHILIVRWWKLLKIWDLFKVFCFCSNLSWPTIHKTHSITPTV